MGAEIVVVHIVGKVAELLVAPVALPLGYLMNYRSNLENLKTAVARLQDRREIVQFAVESAIGQGEEVERHVECWLSAVVKTFEEVAYVFDYWAAEQRCCKGLCPNLKSRYKFSRRAKKMLMVIGQLEYDGKFDTISYRPPLRPPPPPPLTTRRSTLNAILEAMYDADVGIVGVYGMAGSGKTTLVKKVAWEAMEKKLFDVIIMVEVSPTPNIRIIQGQIADQLGLKFFEETAPGRARRLYARLKKETRLLLILDDLWDVLDLEKVGVPFAYDHRGCKLLLTSRNLNVLHMMGAQRNFFIETLQQDEAFDLFRNIVGDRVELSEFQSLAVDVVRECVGVPVAIVTLANALKNKDLYVWKDALRAIRGSALNDIKGVDTNVYSTIKLSYDYLDNQELKFMFLLCGIMENTSFEDLFRYVMGLGLSMSTYTMEEAKIRVAVLVQTLKNSSLLLDTPNSEGLSMHVLVRDVARSIASTNQHMFTVTDDFARWVLADNDRLKNCTAISLHDIDIRELPERLECPQLKIFYFKTNDPLLEVPDNFFTGLPELRVLHLIGIGLLSLPSSLRHLVKLRTLCLNQCKLRDVAVIGGLRELVFLSFHSSDIEKLPEEISALTSLRLLDLSHCSKLKVITPNIISCLTQLEEIYMGNTSIQWEGEELNSARSNAGVAELKHLSHLTTLEIHVQDAKLIPNDLFSETLKRYKVVIGDYWGQPDWYNTDETARALKFSAINVERVWSDRLPVNLTCLVVQGCEKLRCLFSSSIVNSFEQLQYLEICECTLLEEIIVAEELREEERKDLIFPKLSYLKINDLENLRVFSSGGYIKFSCLKELELQNCPELKAFIFNDKVEFPELEKLVVSSMDNLKTIWDNQVVEGSFCNLRSLEIKDCQKLLTVFPSCLCERLLMLESLTVKSCSLVEQIFDLQELNFYEMNLPRLRELYIDYLPNLKHIWNEGPEGRLFFIELQKVTVFLCPNLKNLFPASSASYLGKLESLEVSDCGVEGVLAPGGVNEAAGWFLFPQLVSLQLHRLPELRTFYPDHTVEVPHLRKLGLHHCDKLEVLFISESLYFYETNEDIQLDISKQRPFLVGKDLLNLEELLLSGKAIRINWQVQVPEGFFGLLKSLELNDDKSAVLPLHMIQKFHRLEKLSLNNGSYKEICSYGEIEEQALMLSQIKHLILNELYDLEHIWKQDSHLPLDLGYLKILEVRSCINLIDLMPSSASFRNLTILKVWGCEGLINLVTSSTAKTLVQLENLEVFDCKMMREVIANEGAVTEKIFFSTLKSLSLVYLQNLSSFCSMKHILKFPNLESLVVNECPKMKFFSEGVTSTPSLQKLELNWKVFEQRGVIDLNAIIQRDVEKRLPGREDSSRPSN